MSKRSGIILAVLYTDCSAIRKQHSPSVSPLVCFANRRSNGRPQRLAGGAAVLSSDYVGKGRSGVNSRSHREPAWGRYAGIDRGGHDWLNYRARAGIGTVGVLLKVAIDDPRACLIQCGANTVRGDLSGKLVRSTGVNAKRSRWRSGTGKYQTDGKPTRH
jgi:hypothetical protein